VSWLLVKGQWKMLEDFVVVIAVASVSGTWQNKQLHDVLFVEIRGEITYLEERLPIQKPRDHTSM
jgi:hypothetical protein